jgi:hypothetical protein
VRRNLDAEFAAVGEQGFKIPITNIAGLTAILASSQDPAVQQALRLAQKAWLQLDCQNLAPSQPTNQEQVGESHSHPQASRTLKGHPRQHQRGNEHNNDAQQGSRFTGERPQSPSRGNEAPPPPIPQRPAVATTIEDPSRTSRRTISVRRSMRARRSHHH